MPSSSVISLRVSSELKSQIKTGASAHSLTQVELIRNAVNQYLGPSEDTQEEVSNQLRLLQDQNERLLEQVNVLGELLVAHSEYYFTHHPPLKTDYDKEAAQKSVTKQSSFLHQRVLQHVEGATGFAVFEQEVREKLNPPTGEAIDVSDELDILSGGDS